MKRYLRTNSRAESFIAFKSKHKQNLLKRGYPTNFINQFTTCIRFRDRSLALRPKTKGTDQKRTAFVTRYTLSATKAIKIIHKYWPSLSKTKHLLNKKIPPPRLTFCSNKNLKSHLVRAKLTPLDSHSSPIPKIELPLRTSSSLSTLNVDGGLSS